VKVESTDNALEQLWAIHEYVAQSSPEYAQSELAFANDQIKIGLGAPDLLGSGLLFAYVRLMGEGAQRGRSIASTALASFVMSDPRFRYYSRLGFFSISVVSGSTNREVVWSSKAHKQKLGVRRALYAWSN
jgi:hypothetical protein